MFRFFHTYHPRTWKATIKAGFVNENDGIRCMQHVYLKDEEKFNAVMAKGAALRNLLEETDMPFYFDRMQGGIFFVITPNTKARWISTSLVLYTVSKYYVLQSQTFLGVSMSYPEGLPHGFLTFCEFLLGITTLPKSSILRTIPVAFIYIYLL